VLDLWATWCGPYVSELRGFAKLRQAHPELRLVLAAMDSTVPEIEKEFRQNGLSSDDIVLVDDGNAAKFGLGGVPQTYVIDRNGKFALCTTGFSRMLCHSSELTLPLLEWLRLDDSLRWAKVASRGY
jgi:hypothetical protein